MNNQHLYLIGALEGFTPELARLVSMMNYVRHSTLAAVKGLSVEELDYLPTLTDNSIGALLLHIAAAEAGYQAATFYGCLLQEDEKQEWDAVLPLGDKARQQIKGHELHYYLDKLERVRAKTLEELARRDDQWLSEQSTFGDYSINNYFKWFHVITHEVNHKGQIQILRRRASSSFR